MTDIEKQDQVRRWLSWYRSWYDNIEITNGLQDRAVDAYNIIQAQSAELLLARERIFRLESDLSDIFGWATQTNTTLEHSDKLLNNIGIIAKEALSKEISK